MTNDSPVEQIQDTAEDLTKRGRRAVKDGAEVFGDTVDELRDESSVTTAARKLGRRADRVRTEQPAIFAIAIAVVAFVAGAGVARSLR